MNIDQVMSDYWTKNNWYLNQEINKIIEKIIAKINNNPGLAYSYDQYLSFGAKKLTSIKRNILAHFAIET